jgi:hypothetical protein
VHPAGIQFDEEQDIHPPQPHRVDGKEVAGHDPGCLLAQEHPPRGGRAARGRIQAVSSQRGADRGRRDPNAEVQQFTLDALVAPARVLFGQANDQLLDVLIQ